MNCEFETISGVDLCVIVSNLIKNSVEASLAVQEEKKKFVFLLAREINI